MAIADLNEYKEALGHQREILSINVGTSSQVAGRAYDTWRTLFPVGAIPTVGVAPDNDTLGALGQRNPASGSQLSIIGARFSSLNPGNYIIADRLSHLGGLSAIDTTAQLALTAALTRYTSGEGVMIGLTIYAVVGGTVTTVSAEYTNQDGVTGRNTPTVLFGATQNRETNRLILLPLQSGDTGVRSVQTVTLSSSTGTAGNFGVTLFKPLYTICVDQSSGVLSASGFITGNTCGGIAKVEDNACLFAISICQGTQGTGSGALLLEEN